MAIPRWRRHTLESASVAWDVNGASVKIGSVTYILSNIASLTATGDVQYIYR
ncbi:MAG: hypothetical protein ACNYPG_05800 [Candidatus Porifericomitaceae bacterium WSBS_2022_MAG_OTU9]